jgi:hypothetical protein
VKSEGRAVRGIQVSRTAEENTQKNGIGSLEKGLALLLLLSLLFGTWETDHQFNHPGGRSSLPINIL